ncbi:MAG: protein-S-isoprenylcysteine O-methyltransferase Ste14 [Pseudohongiellaceae bacterium]|jgi:protein-S-isoprenylcysteine O-methyltransferase Ste14
MFSLIWARLRFFNTQSTEVTVWVRLYDPIVGIQILTTLYNFYYTPDIPILASSVWLAALLFSISLFWWAISTARKLDFAFSKNVGDLLTSGPYAVVRHPFYASYILLWASTTILFNSVFLWFTLLYLVTFYFMSARDEEQVILSSEHSKEYFEYRQRVGMFLPRITKWKS